MKTTTRSRGLYRRVTRSPETDDERFEVLRELSNALQDYLDDAERLAAKILRQHGHDPATLWDVVEIPNGQALKITTIARDALPLQAENALTVLENLRTARRFAATEADALTAGIRLAAACEHMNANLTWLKAVEEKRRRRVASSSIADAEITAALEKYKTRKDAAIALNLTERQLRNRIKKIENRKS